MVRRISTSQLKSQLRRLESKQRTAINTTIEQLEIIIHK